MKKRFIFIIILILVVISITSFLFFYNRKSSNVSDDKISLTNKIEKSPYTIDELNDIIKSNYLYGNINIWDQKNMDIGWILTHFYDYFSKETPFIVADKIDENEMKPISFKEINYEEYTKQMTKYLDNYIIDETKINDNHDYVRVIKLFILFGGNF